MKPAFTRRSAIAVATLALLAACATPSQPGSYVPRPFGSTLSYHRVSTGSYGVADGRIDWTFTKVSWQGREVPAGVSPQAGSQLYEPVNHRLLGALNTAGQPMQIYSPPLGYEFPLAVGKRWTSRHMVTLYPSGRQVPFEITYVVERTERLTVPAGTFDTWVVSSTDSTGEVQRVWTAPEIGIGTVKRVLDRPASHPQGAGHLEGELIAK